MNVDLTQFQETFFQECGEALDLMEATLLQLDIGAPDSEMVNTLFRGAHSIKGGAGMFGFAQMTSFTHGLETLLDGLRAGQLSVSGDLVELLLKSVDALREMISAVKGGALVDAALVDPLSAAIAAAAAAPKAEIPTAKPPIATRVPDDVPASPGRDAQGHSTTQWNIAFTPGPALLTRGNDPLRLLQELGGLGPVEVRADCEAVPAFAELDPEICCIRWNVVVHTEAPRDSIELIFDWAQGDCELVIDGPHRIAATSAPPRPEDSQHPAAAGAPPIPSENAAPVIRTEPAPKPSPAQVAGAADHDGARATARDGRPAAADAGSIRVSIEKIDELMNAVGEIVITQSMLTQQISGVQGIAAERLRDGLTLLERNVRELQESVMRVRMLPISVVFSRFPRLVRDLSQRLGKQIELKVSGEHTELDKIVLERIGDPLVHLVRNSIDHGIEAPEIREMSGKPAQGTLTLNAFHKGGSIRISVGDDGKGLDRDRILNKARERGLLAEGVALSDPEIYDLIFAPGLSTAERATDVSGRGVGMDVVRRNIVELGGTVDIDSQAGQGTQINITLPLTLAIVDGQLIGVGGDTYIVPLVTIVESLQIRPGAVSQLAGRGEVFEFRGDFVPLIRLRDLFGSKRDESRPDQGLVMVVEAEGRKVALFVDELLGQQQVVIKSLDTNYRRIEGISGATILGEGAVALILDVPGLIRLAADVNSRRAA
ncbi:MAG: chemotaxis protein CheA [Proteobacteria bacterium]|nr:chemotaxis protein CheA [Pseudomonadota bacterium]